MMRTIRTTLIGVGHVGRNVLHILSTKGDLLAQRHGLRLALICVADSSGVAVAAQEYDAAELRLHKQRGGQVRDLDGLRRDTTPANVLADLECDLVLEASPVNLVDGLPGLAVARTALERGMHLVLANKAPLVLDYAELRRLADTRGGGLAFSATVCGALPVINIGRRDLVAAHISLLRGIFNSTSNFVLAEMAAGRTYAQALSEAQQRGIAERDPSLDVEGWDTASKLVIIANSVLDLDVTLADVRIQGITGIDGADLAAAHEAGQTIKLVAEARATPDGYVLAVEPVSLARESFLGSCDGWEMGVEIHSDLYGQMYHKIWEREPLPTAAAMLRDAVNLLAPSW